MLHFIFMLYTDVFFSYFFLVEVEKVIEKYPTMTPESKLSANEDFTRFVSNIDNYIVGVGIKCFLLNHLQITFTAI